MSKAQSYVKTHDGIDILFNRSEDGELTCAPIDIEAFEAHVANLGPDGVRSKVAELLTPDDEDRSWREEAEKRMDALRRERATEQAKEIYS